MPFKKKEDRICKICGKVFQPNSANQLFCKKEHTAKCKICGKEVENVANFKITKDRVFCSNECLQKSIQETNLKKYGATSPAKNKDVLAKMQATSLERYGYKSPFESPEIQEKIKKTNLEKYGSEYIGGSKEIREKAAKTNLERYGARNVFGSKEIREQIRQTMQERYNVDNYAQTEEYKEKFLNTMIERYGKHYSKTEEYMERVKSTSLKKYGKEFYTQTQEYKDKATSHNMNKYGVEYITSLEEFHEKARETKIKKREDFEAKGYTWFNRLLREYGQGIKKINVPKVCYNSEIFVSNEFLEKIQEYDRYASSFEKEVIEFIKNIYDGKVLLNNRQVISPYEIDIYLPDKSIAIECNGVYWHSTEAGVPVDYHKKKSDLCAKKNIKLIHLNQWIWDNKTKYIKKAMSNIINGKSKKVKDIKFLKYEKLNKDLLQFIKNNSLYKDDSNGYDFYYKMYESDSVISIIGVRIEGNKGIIKLWHNYDFELMTSIKTIEKELFKDFNLTSLSMFLDRDFSSLVEFNLGNHWNVKEVLAPKRMNFTMKDVYYDEEPEEVRALEVFNSGFVKRTCLKNNNKKIFKKHKEE